MNERKVTRRQFLTMAGGVTAAAAVAGAIGGYASAAAKPSDVSRTTGKGYISVPTCCQLCRCRCGILAQVSDGRVLKIEGNAADPNSRGRVCARGQAAPNLVYNPDRLLYPMKRVGARGEGKWQRISWAQALDETSSRLRTLRAAGHPEQFVFQGGSMATPRFVSRFLNAYGTPNSFVNFGEGEISRQVALSSTWGVDRGTSDVSRAKYILNFGSDPFADSPVSLVQRIVDGRVNGGAKLVTFDVRVSKTAGKSDEWLSINPGTDGLCALSMASVIVEEHLSDTAFLDRWSNVSAVNLASYLSAYSPELTESRTGVSAVDVRRIAREFATSKPGTTISGGGVSNRQNGVQNERCIFLLNAVTGNIDVPGGFGLPVSYPLNEPEPVPQKPLGTRDFTAEMVSPHLALSRIGDGSLKAGVLMSYMFNPAYSNADTKAAAEVLKDERLIPYSVVVDILPSETVLYADLVLPDATFLERWDLESPSAYDGVPFVLLRQPVVASPGEAAPFHDVCIELGRRIGGGVEKFSAFRNGKDYLIAMASGIAGLKAAGGVNFLTQTGVWFDDKATPVHKTYEASGFATPSKRLEIKSSELESKGFGALPDYVPIDAYKVVGNEELFLVTYEYGLAGSHMASSKWLSEIEHGAVAWINAETAKDRGIKDGELLEVKSAIGSIRIMGRLTQGIHPRVVAIPFGGNHWGMGRVAQGQNFKSEDPDTKLIWWKNNGNQDSHVKRIIAASRNTPGYGQAWQDTVVTVRRVG